MKPTKKLFFNVVERVEQHCLSKGFVGHPAYDAAWEPANQAYEASLIRSDVSDVIDQLNISFYPSLSAFRFNVQRSDKTFEIKSIDNIPNDAGAWTEHWLYHPFDEYSLLNGTAWNIFSHSLDFKVRKQEPLNVEAEALKVFTAFKRNSVFLFDALEGNYRGRLVEVRHYAIQRPHT